MKKKHTTAYQHTSSTGQWSFSTSTLNTNKLLFYHILSMTSIPSQQWKSLNQMPNNYMRLGV